MAKRVPIEMESPGSGKTNSLAPKKVPLPRLSDTSLREGRSRLGRKRDSEYVFRPLRLKFKAKELEHLYKNYVYRQNQSLLIAVCGLMILLAIILLLIFFIDEKVKRSYFLGLFFSINVSL